MTSDQDVRSRMASLLNEFGSEAAASGSVDYLPHSDDLEAYTDAVIAIVREAMLAPDVISAGGKGCPPPVQVERVVRNVLDAAGLGVRDE